MGTGLKQSAAQSLFGFDVRRSNESNVFGSLTKEGLVSEKTSGVAQCLFVKE